MKICAHVYVCALLLYLLNQLNFTFFNTFYFLVQLNNFIVTIVKRIFQAINFKVLRTRVKGLGQAIGLPSAFFYGCFMKLVKIHRVL